MIPHTYPNNLNPFSDMSQCVITYLSSVSGMTAWTDYIPVRTVSATGNIEGRTESTGYQAVYVLTVLTNKTAWIDYIPVYEDGTKTVAWSTDANGYIPIGISEAGAEQILSEADFQADLTHSLVLDAGTGTPTFTRATTGTIQDNEGVLRTAIAGEARFTGARRVMNLLTGSSEDFSVAGWSNVNTPNLVVDTVDFPTGFTKSNQITPTGVFGGRSNVAVTSGRTYLASCWVKGAVGGEVVGITDSAETGGTVTATTSWVRYSRVFTTAGNFAQVLVNASGATVKFAGYMVEDITGRTDQTTPSEYVSVGVLSAPYHGAGVDGVEFFDTDLDGSPIPAATLKGYLAEPAATNLCLQSNSLTTTWTSAGTLGATQNVVGPDGAVSAWTLTDNDAAATEVLYQPITFTAANYTNHCLVKKTTGAQASYPCLYAYDVASSRVALCTIDTSNGVATVWTAYTGLTVQASSARCSSFNDDFWLVELTFLGTAATWTNAIAFAPAITTNPTQSTGVFDVTVQGSAVFCNFQCELGSAATSYIPTTTVAVARNADVLTYTGGDIASLKTLAATFRREVGVSNIGVSVALDDGTANNRIVFYLDSAAGAAYVTGSGGVTQSGAYLSPAYSPGTQYKQAISVATNDVKIDAQGTAQTPDTSAIAPTITQLDVGHQAGTYHFNGHVGHIYGWTTNKSQSELGAIDR